MNGRAKTFGSTLALAAGALALASAASAQDRPSSETTRALNGAPATSTLTTRPNAQPPLNADRPQAAPARPRPPQQSETDRTLEALLGATADDEPADAAEATPPARRTPSVTLAAGATEPEPIPMTLGYYVRGDKECDEVWPGEGDLAWLTPTAFTIDYGGCEPGQFLQSGPNSWTEEQRCLTERGGDAGAYNVTYEVLGTDVIKRTAKLDIDDSTEEDLWNFCPVDQVPENARFGS
jgi:hypothetical protein